MEEELQKLRDWVSEQYYDLSVQINPIILMRKIEKLKKKAKILDEKAWIYDDLSNS